MTFVFTFFIIIRRRAIIECALVHCSYYLYANFYLIFRPQPNFGRFLSCGVYVHPSVCPPLLALTSFALLECDYSLIEFTFNLCRTYMTLIFFQIGTSTHYCDSLNIFSVWLKKKFPEKIQKNSKGLTCGHY